MSNERKLLFTVDGFEVFSNSVYEVKDKVDGDAPSGFVKARVSKIPSSGVGESFPFRYIIPQGMKTGKWDTGFYKESPMYAFTDDADKKVKELVKNVLEPYRKAVGLKIAVDETNDEVMDSTSFTVKTKLSYNTANPVDTMSLYAALVTKNLVPPGAAGDSRYAKAFYTVEDKTKVIESKHESHALSYECMKKFSRTYDKDKATLDLIFGWMELKLPANASEETSAAILSEYIKDSYDKAKTFLNLVEESETNQGLTKLELYAKLKDAFKKGNKVVKQNGSFFFEGEEIGPDLKSAAENISKNTSLKDVKVELLK